MSVLCNLESTFQLRVSVTILGPEPSKKVVGVLKLLRPDRGDQYDPMKTLSLKPYVL